MAVAPVEVNPRERVLGALRDRESNFLRLVNRGVFENPVNPYGELLRWAGVGYEELAESVRSRGLEGALRELYAAGVYLTHDEFKGKTAVRRGGRTLELENGQLANPAVRGIVDVSSSGSRSKGTVTRRSLEYQLYREAQELFLHEPYELDRNGMVLITSSLPAMSGIRRVVNHRRWGYPVRKWFDGATPFAYRALTRLAVAELAALGRPVVFPEYLPHNDFGPVARYLAAEKRRGRTMVLQGVVSRAVRVAAAATELGLDIAGTIVLTTGEALTEAKRAVIERAGCEAHARYTISELGPVGIGCRKMRGNCVHICKDSVAVISRRRVAPLSEVEVESFLFTALLPEAATILINVEMDDAGELGPAACGCEWTGLGFDLQADKIFSYGKLTGHGATLVGGEMLRILETVLPGAFGGAPTDYQLVEREGANQTEYELRVNPRVAIPSCDAVRERFLAEVKGLWGGGLTVSRWMHGEGVRVVHAEPYAGRRGKVLSLHLLGSGQEAKR
jgi:hypothetical protein